MRLKEFRLKNKKSSEEMANLLQISIQAYYKYESGKSEPTIDGLLKMADYLHITTDELLGRPTSLINVAILNNTQREIIERVQNMPDKEQEYTLLFLKMRDNSL